MNVQQAIINGIREQLFFHDYLVLPNFGGFVLKSNLTRFSGPALINPASKTIGFNVQLRQDDGILAHSLQNTLQCSATEALTHLKEFAEYCNSIIAAKRRLTLENIGFFYLDFENNLCFEPQQDTNFLTDSFGLSPISLKEIEYEKAEIKQETVFVDRKPVATEMVTLEQKKSSKFKQLLAPAAFLILLFGLLAVFVSNNHISGQLKASVFGAYGTNVYQPVNYSDLKLLSADPQNIAYVADANGIALLELNDKTAIPVKVAEGLADHSKTEFKGSFHKLAGLNKHYEIVLGCFGVFENAKRMAAKLSGQNIDVMISEKNNKGLYTVSNGSFETKAAALVKLEELKGSFPNAWIKIP